MPRKPRPKTVHNPFLGDGNLSSVNCNNALRRESPMRIFRAMMAVAMLACVGVGCEQEAPKKPPEQKSNLGAPADPKSATSDTKKP
jgi:hypothetical protein